MKILVTYSSAAGFESTATTSCPSETREEMINAPLFPQPTTIILKTQSPTFQRLILRDFSLHSICG